MRRRFVGGLMLLSLSLAPYVQAGETRHDGDDVEQRLDRLESNWTRLEAEIAEMKAALRTLAVPPGGAEDTASAANQGVANSVEQRLSTVEEYAKSLHGELGEVKTGLNAQNEVLTANSEAQSRALSLSSYGNFVASKRSNEDSTFDASSFEIVLSGQPHDRVGFFSELEFERAATVGGPRGGEILLEQAYVDFSLTDALAFRSGVLLIPFGNVAVDHFSPLRDTISKPLSAFAIAPSDWTDNGFGLIGDTSINDDWHLNYEGYLVTGLGADITSLGLRDARQGFGVDNNGDKSLIARVALSRQDQLSLGFAGYHGAYDDLGNLALDGLGMDFTWRLAPLRFTGELLSMRAQRSDKSAARFWGGYVRTNYDISRLLPYAMSGEDFATAKLSLVYQYGYIHLDDIVSALNESRREWRHTLGLKYEPTRNWILKMNYEVSRAGRLPVLDGDSHAVLMSIGYVF